MVSNMRTPELRVGQVAGYTPAIGHLVSMMAYARATTLRAVNGLSQPQLDFLLDDDANSIGMLLDHIASVEVGYQYDTFGVGAEDAEGERIRIGLDLGAEAREHIRGQVLDQYLGRMGEVRAFTLEQLALRDDAWLEESRAFDDGVVANNHWKWFHVFEDELSHRGQIRIIRKRLPK